jgi:hypothetical protein
VLKLHLDTDLGGDIDDLCALAMVLNCPETIPPAPTSLGQALSLLERSVEQGAVIAAIRPYTNLALLEKRSPGILRSARLYLMGGYVFPPREGFPPWGSDMDYKVMKSSICIWQAVPHSPAGVIGTRWHSPNVTSTSASHSGSAGRGRSTIKSPLMKTADTR